MTHITAVTELAGFVPLNSSSTHYSGIQLPLCEPSDHNDGGKLITSCLHSYSLVIMLIIKIDYHIQCFL